MDFIRKITNSRKSLLAKKAKENLLFTRRNIRINPEIEYDAGGIYAYIEVWFNPVKKFGIKLRGDDVVNVYAYLTPYKNDVEVRYIIHRYDGRAEDEQAYEGLTESEKVLIRQMADEVNLKETGKNVDANWFSVFCDVYR